MIKITADNIQLESEIKKIPKSDLHNHAGYGGNIKHLSNYFHATINPPVKPFDNLLEMNGWFENNINCICGGIKGYIRRVQSAFMQVHEDCVSVICMSFSKAEIDALNGMESFMGVIDGLHARFARQSIFLPELALKRGDDQVLIMSWLEEILSYGWFRSIDICGNEMEQPIEKFKEIYRIAAKYQLRLKAHVGEFGSAEDIRRAVECLHLSEVHHGIAAATSTATMKWLEKEKIQLNICPTSNIMLKRVESYQQHPIKILFQYGVLVTVNTDDMLIFNSSVSREFMKLYRYGLLDIYDIEQIRRQGLKQSFL